MAGDFTFLFYINYSSITAAVPDELLDLEKNESQIEIPPLSIMT